MLFTHDIRYFASKTVSRKLTLQTNPGVVGIIYTRECYVQTSRLFDNIRMSVLNSNIYLSLRKENQTILPLWKGIREMMWYSLQGRSMETWQKLVPLINKEKSRNTLENSGVKKLKCAQPWTIRLTMSGNSRKLMAIQILRIILSRLNLWLNRFYLAKWYRMFQWLMYV